MAADGAFGAALHADVAELVYWKLTGRHQVGEVTSLFGGDPGKLAAAVAQSRAALLRLLAKFADPATPYLSQPHPERRPRFPDYAHLARCAEWDMRESGE